jgi:hypothetical protein
MAVPVNVQLAKKLNGGGIVKFVLPHITFPELSEKQTVNT